MNLKYYKNSKLSREGVFEKIEEVFDLLQNCYD